MNAGVECWNRDVKSYLDSSDIVAYHPFKDDLERFQHSTPAFMADRLMLFNKRLSTGWYFNSCCVSDIQAQQATHTPSDPLGGCNEKHNAVPRT